MAERKQLEHPEKVKQPAQRITAPAVGVWDLDILFVLGWSLMSVWDIIDAVVEKGRVLEGDLAVVEEAQAPGG